MSDCLQYLERAFQMTISPNFWLTKEYLSFQKDMVLKELKGWIWLQEGEWAVFPPLPSLDYTPSLVPPKLKIWSDFGNYSLGSELEFLDWEYTYHSRDFSDMRGKKWAVFRKNSRKWPQRNNNWAYTVHAPPNKQIEALLIKWLCKKSNEEIEDAETLLWFVFNGTRRAFLYHHEELIGINIWDECYFSNYVVYRYVIVNPDEPFLDEFMRLLFYQNVQAYVIDGGVLGRPGLERFKDKLNPIYKRPIYSRQII
ncbi:MAG: hypothetical protein BWX44_00065 [Spirochaetes bacterium ADurb.Bin001]|nr:MAG: hypothetical protein BWX44_00065 [Spirochaetes bacterium ADurb.Bin001]